MDEILLLRYELTQILGFNNYFKKSLKTKLAQFVQQIFNFLINLNDHVWF